MRNPCEPSLRPTMPTALFILGLCLALSATTGADTLIREDGAPLSGRFIGYSAGQFQFQIGQQVINLASDEVSQISVPPPEPDALTPSVNQLHQTLAYIIQRIERIEATLVGFEQQRASDVESMQDRLYNLRPVSKLRIEEDSGDFQRNGSFLVRGRLRNLSPDKVYYPKVRIELLDANGAVVATQLVALSSQAVNSGGYLSFRHTFEAPPPFVQYRISPVVDVNPPREETGEAPARGLYYPSR